MRPTDPQSVLELSASPQTRKLHASGAGSIKERQTVLFARGFGVAFRRSPSGCTVLVMFLQNITGTLVSRAGLAPWGSKSIH